MQLDLRCFAERGEHSQVDHAAHLLIEPRAAPGIAPAPFSSYVLKRHHEFVRTLEGVVDIFCTKHFAAQFEATVEPCRPSFQCDLRSFSTPSCERKGFRNNVTSRSRLPRKHHGGLVWWRASQRRTFGLLELLL